MCLNLNHNLGYSTCSYRKCVLFRSNTAKGAHIPTVCEEIKLATKSKLNESYAGLKTRG